jgi:hypothetical protein
MVDMTAITGTVSALKGAVDIAKAMIGLRDVQVVQLKVIELNSKILEAQHSALSAVDERTALIQRIRDLEKEIIGLKAWGVEKENYELRNVYTGAFAYVPKANTLGPEPPHWLCATCYENRKKSLLQDHGRASDDLRMSIYKCSRSECGSEIRVSFNVNPTTLAALGA